MTTLPSEVKAALRERIINELQHYDIFEHGLPLFGDLRTTWERVADRTLETIQPEIERLEILARQNERLQIKRLMRVGSVYLRISIKDWERRHETLKRRLTQSNPQKDVQLSNYHICCACHALGGQHCNSRKELCNPQPNKENPK